jgi:hypothetical protein
MDSTHGASAPHPKRTSEHARNVRARAWAYAFDCYRKKEAATSPVRRPDDAERSLDDGARNIIQDTK